MADSNQRRSHVGRIVRQQIELAASPEEVWNAWVRPEQISQWFVDRAEGDLEHDRKAVWCWDWFSMRCPFQVYEVDPGRKIALGAEAHGGPEGLLEIALAEERGKTVVRVANSGFLDGADWDEEYEGVDSGWTAALCVLKAWLESYGGARERRPRVHHFTAIETAFDYAVLQRFYKTAAGLDEWLSTGAQCAPQPLSAGGTVELEVLGLGPLRGRVASVSRTEITFTWPELRGLLTLKAFRSGPGKRMVGLHFNSWGLDPAQKPQIAEHLDQACARLAKLASRQSGLASS
ncbi:MAG: SRPBCC domain-containing protein [Planctomycetes bacterium]|nr:SRPBCC domain-containing protein [Planctomycetota bacterium]